MPQMSPMYWNFTLIFITLMLMIMILKMYFMYTPMINKNLNKIYFNKLFKMYKW
uniref:ATP synthase F0 subunit 8 n=1 Tax=Eustenogaster scitula TaxID=1980568 RepID=A0A509ZZN3_9HYME|nr:ATP synthase F0 subunit 8 [Eustenogaster scitula]ARO89841.1 ATP synthase F0 subunit 8 [Eustenogaster scitula]